MNEELLKYYEYLKGQKADVPDTFESFNATLSDDISARKYYDYLRQNDFDTPDSYESFQSTFGLKKKSLQDGIGDVLAPVFAEPQGGSQPVQTASAEQPIASPSDQGEILVNAPQVVQPTDEGFMDISKPVPGFVLPTEPTEFERLKAIHDDRALRKGLGIDGPDPMTAMEQAGSFAGSFNKPIVDMISSIPKAGAIVRRYLDVAMGNDPKPVQAYDMYKLGAAIDKKALDLGITYTDPRNAGSFFGEGVPSGLGSVLAIMSTGGGASAESAMAKTSVKELGLLDAGVLAGKDLGRMATTRPVVAGANMMGIQEFQQAKAAGATDEMALDVYLKNLPIGATEAIPMERAFARIANFTGGLGQVAKAATVGALEEGAQEGLQQWLTNKVAAGTYDPKREPWADLVSSMGVGAFIGFFLPMLGKAGQILTADQQKETVAAINKVLKEESVVAPKADVGTGDFTNLDKLVAEQEAKADEKPQPQPAEAKQPEQPGPAPAPETPKEEALPPKAKPEGEVKKSGVYADVPADLQERGEQVPSNLVAKTRFRNGDRIFAFPEQDAEPVELTSVAQMDKYASDQLMAYKPQEDVDKVQAIIDNEDLTTQEIADEIEALEDHPKASELSSAIKKYKAEIEEDYDKWGGRGDSEQYEEEFLAEVRRIIGPVESQPEKEVAKPEEKVDPTEPGGEKFEELRQQLESATGEEYDDEAVQLHVDASGGWDAEEDQGKPAEEVVQPKESEAYVPKDGWETHLIKAREYATNLGIDFKGKGLPDLVGEINKKLEEKPAGTPTTGEKAEPKVRITPEKVYSSKEIQKPKERSKEDIDWIMTTRLPKEKRGESVNVKLIRNGKEETISMPAHEVIVDFKNRLGLKKTTDGKSSMEQLIDCFGKK